MELTFERHPVYFHPDVGALNTLCEEPGRLAETAGRVLRGTACCGSAGGAARTFAQMVPRAVGKSAEAIAKTIHHAVTGDRPPLGELTANDHRRGLTLRAFNAVGWPCNHDPLLFLKRRLFPADYAVKQSIQNKNIRPKDVAAARERWRDIVRG